MLRRASSIAFCTATGTSLRLALAHADAAVAVADHGQRREAEDAAALHHLGDAVDRDHLLAQTVVAAFVLRCLLESLPCS